MILLLVIVSLLPFFFSFCWLSLILIILKENKNLLKSIFIGTLFSILVVVFSVIGYLRLPDSTNWLKVNAELIQLQTTYSWYIFCFGWNKGEMEEGGDVSQHFLNCCLHLSTGKIDGAELIIGEFSTIFCAQFSFFFLFLFVGFCNFILRFMFKSWLHIVVLKAELTKK